MQRGQQQQWSLPQGQRVRLRCNQEWDPPDSIVRARTHQSQKQQLELNKQTQVSISQQRWPLDSSKSCSLETPRPWLLQRQTTAAAASVTALEAATELAGLSAARTGKTNSAAAAIPDKLQGSAIAARSQALERDIAAERNILSPAGLQKASETSACLSGAYAATLKTSSPVAESAGRPYDEGADCVVPATAAHRFETPSDAWIDDCIFRFRLCVSKLPSSVEDICNFAENSDVRAAQNSLLSRSPARAGLVSLARQKHEGEEKKDLSYRGGPSSCIVSSKSVVNNRESETAGRAALGCAAGGPRCLTGGSAPVKCSVLPFSRHLEVDEIRNQMQQNQNSMEQQAQHPLLQLHGQGQVFRKETAGYVGEASSPQPLRQRYTAGTKEEDLAVFAAAKTPVTSGRREALHCPPHLQGEDDRELRGASTRAAAAVVAPDERFYFERHKAAGTVDDVDHSAGETQKSSTAHSVHLLASLKAQLAAALQEQQGNDSLSLLQLLQMREAVQMPSQLLRLHAGGEKLNSSAKWGQSTPAAIGDDSESVTLPINSRPPTTAASVDPAKSSSANIRRRHTDRSLRSPSREQPQVHHGSNSSAFISSPGKLKTVMNTQSVHFNSEAPEPSCCSTELAVYNASIGAGSADGGLPVTSAADVTAPMAAAFAAAGRRGADVRGELKRQTSNSSEATTCSYSGGSIWGSRRSTLGSNETTALLMQEGGGFSRSLDSNKESLAAVARQRKPAALTAEERAAMPGQKSTEREQHPTCAEESSINDYIGSNSGNSSNDQVRVQIGEITDDNSVESVSSSLRSSAEGGSLFLRKAAAEDEEPGAKDEEKQHLHDTVEEADETHQAKEGNRDGRRLLRLLSISLADLEGDDAEIPAQISNGSSSVSDSRSRSPGTDAALEEHEPSSLRQHHQQQQRGGDDEMMAQVRPEEKRKQDIIDEEKHDSDRNNGREGLSCESNSDEESKRSLLSVQEQQPPRSSSVSPVTVINEMYECEDLFKLRGAGETPERNAETFERMNREASTSSSSSDRADARGIANQGSTAAGFLDRSEEKVLKADISQRSMNNAADIIPSIALKAPSLTSIGGGRVSSAAAESLGVADEAAEHPRRHPPETSYSNNSTNPLLLKLADVWLPLAPAASPAPAEVQRTPAVSPYYTSLCSRSVVFTASRSPTTGPQRLPAPARTANAASAAEDPIVDVAGSDSTLGWTDMPLIINSSNLEDNYGASKASREDRKTAANAVAAAAAARAARREKGLALQERMDAIYPFMLPAAATCRRDKAADNMHSSRCCNIQRGTRKETCHPRDAATIFVGVRSTLLRVLEDLHMSCCCCSRATAQQHPTTQSPCCEYHFSRHPTAALKEGSRTSLTVAADAGSFRAAAPAASVSTTAATVTSDGCYSAADKAGAAGPDEEVLLELQRKRQQQRAQEWQKEEETQNQHDATRSLSDRENAITLSTDKAEKYQQQRTGAAAAAPEATIAVTTSAQAQPRPTARIATKEVASEDTKDNRQGELTPLREGAAAKQEIAEVTGGPIRTAPKTAATASVEGATIRQEAPAELDIVVGMEAAADVEAAPEMEAAPELRAVPELRESPELKEATDKKGAVEGEEEPLMEWEKENEDVASKASGEAAAERGHGICHKRLRGEARELEKEDDAGTHSESESLLSTRGSSYADNTACNILAQHQSCHSKYVALQTRCLMREEADAEEEEGAEAGASDAADEHAEQPKAIDSSATLLKQRTPPLDLVPIPTSFASSSFSPLTASVSSCCISDTGALPATVLAPATAATTTAVQAPVTSGPSRLGGVAAVASAAADVGGVSVPSAVTGMGVKTDQAFRAVVGLNATGAAVESAATADAAVPAEPVSSLTKASLEANSDDRKIAAGSAASVPDPAEKFLSATEPDSKMQSGANPGTFPTAEAVAKVAGTAAAESAGDAGAADLNNGLNFSPERALMSNQQDESDPCTPSVPDAPSSQDTRTGFASPPSAFAHVFASAPAASPCAAGKAESVAACGSDSTGAITDTQTKICNSLFCSSAEEEAGGPAPSLGCIEEEYASSQPPATASTPATTAEGNSQETAPSTLHVCGLATATAGAASSRGMLHEMFHYHADQLRSALAFVELLPYVEVFRPCLSAYVLPSLLPPLAQQLLLSELELLRAEPSRYICSNAFLWTGKPGAMQCMEDAELLISSQEYLTPPLLSRAGSSRAKAGGSINSPAGATITGVSAGPVSPPQTRRQTLQQAQQQAAAKESSRAAAAPGACETTKEISTACRNAKAGAGGEVGAPQRASSLDGRYGEEDSEQSQATVADALPAIVKTQGREVDLQNKRERVSSGSFSPPLGRRDLHFADVEAGKGEDFMLDPAIFFCIAPTELAAEKASLVRLLRALRRAAPSWGAQQHSGFSHHLLQLLKINSLRSPLLQAYRIVLQQLQAVPPRLWTYEDVSDALRDLDCISSVTYEPTQPEISGFQHEQQLAGQQQQQVAAKRRMDLQHQLTVQQQEGKDMEEQQQPRDEEQHQLDLQQGRIQGYGKMILQVQDGRGRKYNDNVQSPQQAHVYQQQQPHFSREHILNTLQYSHADLHQAAGVATAAEAPRTQVSDEAISIGKDLCNHPGDTHAAVSASRHLHQQQQQMRSGVETRLQHATEVQRLVSKNGVDLRERDNNMGRENNSGRDVKTAVYASETQTRSNRSWRRSVLNAGLSTSEAAAANCKRLQELLQLLPPELFDAATGNKDVKEATIGGDRSSTALHLAPNHAAIATKNTPPHMMDAMRQQQQQEEQQHQTMQLYSLEGTGEALRKGSGMPDESESSSAHRSVWGVTVLREQQASPSSGNEGSRRREATSTYSNPTSMATGTDYCKPLARRELHEASSLSEESLTSQEQQEQGAAAVGGASICRQQEGAGFSAASVCNNYTSETFFQLHCQEQGSTSRQSQLQEGHKDMKHPSQVFHAGAEQEVHQQQQQLIGAPTSKCAEPSGLPVVASSSADRLQRESKMRMPGVSPGDSFHEAATSVDEIEEGNNAAGFLGCRRAAGADVHACQDEKVAGELVKQQIYEVTSAGDSSNTQLKQQKQQHQGSSDNKRRIEEIQDSASAKNEEEKDAGETARNSLSPDISCEGLLEAVQQLLQMQQTEQLGRNSNTSSPTKNTDMPPGEQQQQTLLTLLLQQTGFCSGENSSSASGTSEDMRYQQQQGLHKDLTPTAATDSIPAVAAGVEQRQPQVSQRRIQQQVEGLTTASGPQQPWIEDTASRTAVPPIASCEGPDSDSCASYSLLLPQSKRSRQIPSVPGVARSGSAPISSFYQTLRSPEAQEHRQGLGNSSATTSNTTTTGQRVGQQQQQEVFDEREDNERGMLYDETTAAMRAAGSNSNNGSNMGLIRFNTYDGVPPRASAAAGGGGEDEETFCRQRQYYSFDERSGAAVRSSVVGSMERDVLRAKATSGGVDTTTVMPGGGGGEGGTETEEITGYSRGGRLRRAAAARARAVSSKLTRAARGGQRYKTKSTRNKRKDALSPPKELVLRREYALRAAELPKIKGVFIGKKNTCWVAQWIDDAGQPRQSCFNIRQHGFDRARCLAIEARRHYMSISAAVRARTTEEATHSSTQKQHRQLQATVLYPPLSQPLASPFDMKQQKTQELLLQQAQTLSWLPSKAAGSAAGTTTIAGCSPIKYDSAGAGVRNDEAENDDVVKMVTDMLRLDPNTTHSLLWKTEGAAAAAGGIASTAAAGVGAVAADVAAVGGLAGDAAAAGVLAASGERASGLFLQSGGNQGQIGENYVAEKENKERHTGEISPRLKRYASAPVSSSYSSVFSSSLQYTRQLDAAAASPVANGETHALPIGDERAETVEENSRNRDRDNLTDRAITTEALSRFTWSSTAAGQQQQQCADASSSSTASSASSAQRVLLQRRAKSSSHLLFNTPKTAFTKEEGRDSSRNTGRGGGGAVTALANHNSMLPGDASMPAKMQLQLVSSDEGHTTTRDSGVLYPSSSTSSAPYVSSSSSSSSSSYRSSFSSSSSSSLQQSRILKRSRSDSKAILCSSNNSSSMRVDSGKDGNSGRWGSRGRTRSSFSFIVEDENDTSLPHLLHQHHRDIDQQQRDALRGSNNYIHFPQKGSHVNISQQEVEQDQQHKRLRRGEINSKEPTPSILHPALETRHLTESVEQADAAGASSSIITVLPDDSVTHPESSSTVTNSSNSMSNDITPKEEARHSRPSATTEDAQSFAAAAAAAPVGSSAASPNRNNAESLHVQLGELEQLQRLLQQHGLLPSEQHERRDELQKPMHNQISEGTSSPSSPLTSLVSCLLQYSNNNSAAATDIGARTPQANTFPSALFAAARSDNLSDAANSPATAFLAPAAGGDLDAVATAADAGVFSTVSAASPSHAALRASSLSRNCGGDRSTAKGNILDALKGAGALETRTTPNAALLPLSSTVDPAHNINVLGGGCNLLQQLQQSPTQSNIHTSHKKRADNFANTACAVIAGGTGEPAATDSSLSRGTKALEGIVAGTDAQTAPALASSGNSMFVNSYCTSSAAFSSPPAAGELLKRPWISGAAHPPPLSAALLSVEDQQPEATPTLAGERSSVELERCGSLEFSSEGESSITHQATDMQKQAKKSLASLAREFPAVPGISYNVKCSSWEVAVPVVGTAERRVAAEASADFAKGSTLNKEATASELAATAHEQHGEEKARIQARGGWIEGEESTGAPGGDKGDSALVVKSFSTRKLGGLQEAYESAVTWRERHFSAARQQ